MDKILPLTTREYGSSEPFIFVLHGGPGAPGYMAPVCVRLGRDFRVIEPFQRASGDIKLTVEQHIDDLAKVIACYTKEKVAIVGHSWGGMIGLAFASKYPELVDRLVIIGCGTFDKSSRAVMEKTRNDRIDMKTAERIKAVSEQYEDKDERLGALGAIYQQIDSYELIRSSAKKFRCDALGHEQSWTDMMRLQDEGVYPAEFAKIDSPVLMMHGGYDSHPGSMIAANLREHINQLKYVEFDNCGHYPWLEKASINQFYDSLRNWLTCKNDK